MLSLGMEHQSLDMEQNVAAFDSHQILDMEQEVAAFDSR